MYYLNSQLYIQNWFHMLLMSRYFVHVHGHDMKHIAKRLMILNGIGQNIMKGHKGKRDKLKPLNIQSHSRFLAHTNNLSLSELQFTVSQSKFQPSK